MKIVKYRYLLHSIMLLVLILLAFSCSEPADKDEYIGRFEQFVDKVEEHSGDYKQSDWEWADARFEKFNREWYSRFRDELTSEDQIKIAELRLRYRALKTGSALQKLKDALRNGAEDVKEDLRNYLDNQADEDLETLVEGARAIGDSAVKVMEDVISTLGKKKE